MKTFEDWFENFDNKFDLDLNNLKIITKEAFMAGLSSIWFDASKSAPVPQNDKSLHSVIVLSDKGDPVYYNFYFKEWFKVEIDNFFKTNLTPIKIEKWCWPIH